MQVKLYLDLILKLAESTAFNAVKKTHRNMYYNVHFYSAYLS